MNVKIKHVPAYLGFSRILLLIGIFLILLSLSSTLAASLLAYFYDIPLKEIPKLMQDVPRTARLRQMNLIFQGVSALGGFIISAWIFISLVERESFKVLNPRSAFNAKNVALVTVLFLGVMPFSSWLIDLNAHLDFPSFLSEFENWAHQKEKRLSELTFFLIRFQSFGEFLLGFLVIGVLPGIGEELIFRGILQRNLISYINPHIAILLTAIIFSAIHLQFYGFFPRMFLGLLLGYVYFWSGNLNLAIWAHIFNNGFTLTMVYLYQQGLISYNLMQIKAMPWYLVLLSGLLTTGILFLFWKRNNLSERGVINDKL
jgi:hypothetical protein